MTYSPKPVEAYFLPYSKGCTMKWCAEHEHAEAMWNWYWLATPSVDYIPGNPKWWEQYETDPVHLSTLVLMFNSDPGLRLNLVKHPREFHGWWMRQRRYDDQALHSTIARRALESAERMAATTAHILSNNVIKVQFGKRSA